MMRWITQVLKEQNEEEVCSFNAWDGMQGSAPDSIGLELAVAYRCGCKQLVPH